MNEPNIFIPSNQRSQEEVASESTQSMLMMFKNTMTSLSQFLVVAGIGLLPLLFVYGGQNSLAFDRVFLATVIAGAAIVFASLLLLFKKRIESVLPKTILFLALFVVWGIISAFASGDSYDAIWGLEMEQLTVAFALLMLVFVGLPLLLQSSRKMQVRALGLIGMVSTVVLVQTALWYWFSWSFLSLGELVVSHQSLVGGFNDSAIYAGLVVILGLTTLIMLPLRSYAQVALAVVSAVGLSVLLLVNFSFVWFALAVVSLVTTGYIMLRKLLFQSVPVPPIGGVAKLVSFLVFIISVTAVLYGPQIALSLSNTANTQFVEVLPSFEASVDIVSGVYDEDLLLGVGPNRYEDAWRAHKDTEINELLLWDVDFRTGDSYVLSVFATYGLIGGIMLVLFHLSFVWFGVARLTREAAENTFARYATTLSFVGALFLWAMTYVYTPSVTLLLLAASLTGLTFATSTSLEGVKKISVPAITNRKRGFVVLFIAILCVGLSLSAVVATAGKYFEQTNIEDGIVTNNDEIIGQLANEKINDLTRFISAADPESVDQEELLGLSRAALEASRQAVDLDPTNPRHLERLASLYGLLGAVGVDGGYLSAAETLRDVIAVDPKNPKHHLAMARILVADGDIAGARESLREALELKRNYTEAVRLETEIMIANNDGQEAIDRVEGLVQLDPDVAPRWYQLGVLYSTAGNSEEAIDSLLRAVRLDPSYADARYMLALEFVKENRSSEALSQLEIVERTNPNNSQLQSLIAGIESGEIASQSDRTPVFEEPEPVVDSESGVSVPSGVPTDLITPVNVGAPNAGS